jgi:hypothetical protein
VKYLLAALLLPLPFAACRSDPGSQASKTQQGAVSPDGHRHPGQIVFVDRIEQTVERRYASDVPQSTAWVQLGGAWVPVEKIEITGTKKLREFISYGPDDRFLMATIRAPQ